MCRIYGRESPGLCEVIHIRPIFFPARSPEPVSGWTIGAGFSRQVQANGSGPTIVAVREGRTAMAVAPDRDHGTDRSSRHAGASRGPAGAGEGPRPVGPTGVLSLRCRRLAPLIVTRPIGLLTSGKTCFVTDELTRSRHLPCLRICLAFDSGSR